MPVFLLLLFLAVSLSVFLSGRDCLKQLRSISVPARGHHRRGSSMEMEKMLDGEGAPRILSQTSFQMEKMLDGEGAGPAAPPPARVTPSPARGPRAAIGSRKGDQCGVTFETDPIADAETKFCEESSFTKSECRSHDCCFWGSGSKTCLWSRYDAGKCTQARLDVTAADARGASAFSTLLLVGALLLIAAFIVGRKATRAAESQPLLATTA